MPAQKQTRPKPGKVVAARLTDQEAAALTRLLKIEQKKTKDAGSRRRITRALVLRRLVRKAAKAAGVWD